MGLFQGYIYSNKPGLSVFTTDKVSNFLIYRKIRFHLKAQLLWQSVRVHPPHCNN